MGRLIIRSCLHTAVLKLGPVLQVRENRGKDVELSTSRVIQRLAEGRPVVFEPSHLLVERQETTADFQTVDVHREDRCEEMNAQVIADTLQALEVHHAEATARVAGPPNCWVNSYDEVTV